MFNRSDAVTFGNVISGTGSVFQVGSGTLTLPNANTYNGGTTLLTGCLVYGNGAAFGSGTLTLAGGTLAEGVNLVTLNNAIFVGSGDNTYVTVSNGTYTDIKFGGA